MQVELERFDTSTFPGLVVILQPCFRLRLRHPRVPSSNTSALQLDGPRTFDHDLNTLDFPRRER